MEIATKQMLNEVLELPKPIRAFLSEKLLESLEYDDDFQISKEWDLELERRCKEIDNGKTQLISFEEVCQKLQAVVS
jgi:putative addiction module component (TIGR02574 family)